MTWLSPLWFVAAGMLFVAAFAMRSRACGDDWGRVLSAGVSAFLRGGAHGGRHGVNLLLLAAALAALALASPAMLARDENAFRHAQSWIVAIDVSKSMAETDIAPSRLAAARDVAVAIVDRAQSRPVGLVLYAGDAYLAMPPATDKRQMLAFLQGMTPGMIPVQGSDPARALALAASVLEQGEAVQGRVFLLTDGNSDGGDPVPVAAHLAAKGARADIIVFDADRALSEKSAAMARAAGGLVLAADALGRTDLDRLTAADLTGDGGALISTPLATSVWRLQSHWILLLALPLLLLAFARRAT